ncbi:LacI family DNA-binding transcriptional regulator [Rhizobium sp. CSW-27]|uniref:LacI family DNA-binding transcriptional regulator n=1 Tax=Rhizobium sp. CSW-27 TaxID=2839985 RepID=UPI001C029524|nr:LacI family DNA-binding transcriptional regulator [Rhizobium sp. CSW-27]MBT9371133.1 LacI family transcriptional regulator [Rhizobium sp. CSW-27]
MQIQLPPEPTLKDIAAAAGVSIAAVSKVLNNRGGVAGATRDRVLHIADQLGYRGRAGRQVGSISVLTLEQYVSHDAFYGDVLASIGTTGSALGLDVSVTVQRDLAEMLAPGGLPQAQGFLLVGVDHPELVQSIAGLHVPAVIVNGMDPSMRLPSVAPDYLYGAWAATKHLLELGHRDIVHVTHAWRETFRRRVAGFRSALEEGGLTFDPVRNLLDLGAPQHINLSARDIVERWLDDGNVMPTAFFCVNDMVALGVIQAVERRGLSVPEDVSVVGFDGLALGGFGTPPLTTVSSDRHALGRISVELIAARMADTTGPVQRVSVGVDLLLRRSTAAPRGQPELEPQ